MSAQAVVRRIEKYSFLLPLGGTMTVTEYWHFNVFRLGILLKHVNFGVDMTLYEISSFLANNQYSLPCHALQRKLKLLIAKFLRLEVDLTKAAGGFVKVQHMQTVKGGMQVLQNSLKQVMATERGSACPTKCDRKFENDFRPMYSCKTDTVIC